jgi:nicotinate phosphoribosyltransferase
MRRIITSILDNDLYKFTMLNAVLKLYPDQQVEYTFHNRDKRDVPTAVYIEFAKQVGYMAEVGLTLNEELYLRQNFSELFDEDFFEFLRNFRFDPEQVKMDYIGQDLKMTIKGTWESTILWEVVLMSLLSEIFFAITAPDTSLKQFKINTADKGEILKKNGIKFMEFGTRRRMSKLTQSLAISLLKITGKTNFLGTSNVYLGMLHDVPVKGTVAHEWIMYHGAVVGYKMANEEAIEAWREVYGTELDTVLPDTYTSKSFFDTVKIPVTSLRQDSGDPELFTSRAHMYFSEQAQGKTISSDKTIIYSDNLNVERVLELNVHDGGYFNKIFAIGTNFTNDVEGVKPLNIVIKMSKANGKPTVKLSDTEGKHTGDQEEITKCKKELGL